MVAAEIRSDGFKKSLALISDTREGKAFPLEEVRAALTEVLELTSRMKEMIKTLVS